MELNSCVSFFSASDFTDHYYLAKESPTFLALRATSWVLSHMNEGQVVCYTLPKYTYIIKDNNLCKDTHNKVG